MMSSVVKMVVVAAVAVGVTAQPHGHAHHRHEKKHPGSPVEKRAVVTTWVPGPVVTQYVLDGQDIAPDQAKAGIEAGVYVIVGQSTPSSSVVSSSATPTPTSTSSKQDGQFFEQKSTSTSSAVAAPTLAAAAAAAPAAPASGGTGLTADFPSGTIPCSQFPSDYGALAVDYLGMSGWIGVQKVPNYAPGAAAINYIVTGISGDACGSNSFCSYACPAGYEKSQWPASQGETGQSIGGLYCNANGMLELSRPEVKTLCTPGAGGVFIQNNLPLSVAVCRTDYPGTESETVPLDTAPGGKYPLTNTFSPTYYQWQGKPTTGQWYVNPKGVAVQNACLWNSPTNPTSAGNWAPINIGIGKNSEGITYISIFPNKPTTDAVLDFDIEITGDVSAPCALKGGVFSNGITTGCTVSVDTSNLLKLCC